MSNSGPLAGTTVLDFSHRLPGPLAGHLLSCLGAKVIKVEDHIFKDPFIQDNGPFDQSFYHWYKELNQNKELIRLDFSHPEKRVLDQLLEQADAIIMGPPEKKRMILGLDRSNLELKKRPMAIIEPIAGGGRSVLHDLNALALAEILPLYIQNAPLDLRPPFLPWAGIIFGHRLALELLANLIKAKDKNGPIFQEVALLDAVKEAMTPFWPEQLRKNKQTRFLHNGLYPCYQIYKTSDGGHLALACVEEKFWLSFIDCFQLRMTGQDRFDTSGVIRERIAKHILSKTYAECCLLLKDKDICVSTIDPQATKQGE